MTIPTRKGNQRVTRQRGQRVNQMLDTLQTAALNGKMQGADVTIDFIAKMHHQVLCALVVIFVSQISFVKFRNNSVNFQN